VRGIDAKADEFGMFEDHFFERCGLGMIGSVQFRPIFELPFSEGRARAVDPRRTSRPECARARDRRRRRSHGAAQAPTPSDHRRREQPPPRFIAIENLESLAARM